MPPSASPRRSGASVSWRGPTIRSDVLARHGPAAGIARLTLHAPRLLLLDEPYTGLDTQGTRILDDLLAELGDREAVVLVTHELDRALELAGEVVVMRNGRVAAARDRRGPARAVPVRVPGAHRMSPRGRRQYLALLRKDLRLEFRTRETVVAMGLFSLVIIILFEFTIGERIGNTAPIAGGIIWATLALGAVLGVGRTWVPEREQRVLDAILIAPVSRLVMMAARTTSLVIFLLGVQVVVVRWRSCSSSTGPAPSTCC